MNVKQVVRIKSALVKKLGKFSLLAVCVLIACGFAYPKADNNQLLLWSNTCLKKWFIPESDGTLKNWSLKITPDYFVRLKENYTNGKQEYYSFHLHKFKDIAYNGTSATGMLRLLTDTDNIIVQTYNDPKGNVDSMSSYLNLNVHNVMPEQLDSFRTILLRLRERY